MGPILGSIVAAGFYKFIKILEYETANPDQDAAERAHNEKVKNRADYSNQQQQSPIRPSHSSHTYGDFADNNDPDRQVSASAMPMPLRKPSTAVASPPMGTANDAFAGLSEGGMHSGQNAVHSEAVDSPGMVLSDGMVRRLGRGSSYMA